MTNLTLWINQSVTDFALSGQELTLSDALTQVCQGIDQNIVLMASILFFASVFRMVVVTRAIEYWKRPGPLMQSLPSDQILKFISYLDSLLETFFIGASVFIIYIAYVQYGLSLKHWLLISAGLFIIGLVLVAKIIGWVRKKWHNG